MTEYETLKKEQDDLNNLRSEDYKKLQKIMIEWCDFTNLESRNEPCYINLWAINNFIGDLEQKTIKSIGDKKKAAETHLKTLYEIQQQYGKFYFESIIYRTKVSELERNQFKFLERIKELEKENTMLKKQNEF